MILVMGGAFQGKLRWAKEEYHLREGWIDGETCGMEEIWSCSGISRFHEYIKRALKLGMLTEEEEGDAFVRELYERNPRLVVVTNELGYGIVPIEPFDRLYRERTGRICTGIAAGAREVVRVVCGIGIKLKKAEEEKDD